MIDVTCSSSILKSLCNFSLARGRLQIYLQDSKHIHLGWGWEKQLNIDLGDSGCHKEGYEYPYMNFKLKSRVYCPSE